jgi:hypothetical protein
MRARAEVTAPRATAGDRSSTHRGGSDWTHTPGRTAGPPTRSRAGRRSAPTPGCRVAVRAALRARPSDRHAIPRSAPCRDPDSGPRSCDVPAARRGSCRRPRRGGPADRPARPRPLRPWPRVPPSQGVPSACGPQRTLPAVPPRGPEWSAPSIARTAAARRSPVSTVVPHGRASPPAWRAASEGARHATVDPH